MVMIIGLMTMGVLVWVLALCMARESDAEKRRVTARFAQGVSPIDAAVLEKTRKAA